LESILTKYETERKQNPSRPLDLQEFDYIWGSGLVFCLSQKSHTNTLKFLFMHESDTAISYLQDDILRRSPAHL
jgi:hypothetical protein